MKGSADFRADAWARVVACVVADVDGVSPAVAEQLLTAARIHPPKTLNAVDRYLRAHPNGVASPDADCPRGVMRLSHVLVGAGYSSVRPPQCTQCDSRRPLTAVGPSGRICDHCRRVNQPIICTRRHKPSTHRVNLPDGPVCSNCYSRDPRSKAVCSNYGRLGHRRRRLADGGVLCPACAPRPSTRASAAVRRAPPRPSPRTALSATAATPESRCPGSAGCAGRPAGANPALASVPIWWGVPTAHPQR